jgi:hypothetical protein
LLPARAGDLRSTTHRSSNRPAWLSTVVLDGRALQSACESGPRRGCVSRKRNQRNKVQRAVDALVHFLAVHATAANGQERTQDFELCKAVQTVVANTVELAKAYQGGTGEQL